MKNIKSKIILCIFVILLLITFIIIVFANREKCSYKWVEVDDSMIGQYRLYVVDKEGNCIDGVVEITYLNGEKEKVDIPKDGVLYVKNIILEVSNPKMKRG